MRSGRSQLAFAPPVVDSEGEPTGDVFRLIDTAPMGYLTTDAHGVIEGVNSTLLEWLGYEREDLVRQRTFQQLLAPGGRIYHDTHLRPLLEIQNEFHEIALEVMRADRTRLSVLINAIRRNDPRTGAWRIEMVLIDASERRRYEQELLAERRQAESSESRLQLLYDVVSGLATAISVTDVVDVIATRGRGSTSGAACTVWLFDPGDEVARRIGTVTEESNKLAERLSLPERAPALDRLRAGKLLTIPDVATEDRFLCSPRGCEKPVGVKPSSPHWP